MSNFTGDPLYMSRFEIESSNRSRMEEYDRIRREENEREDKAKAEKMELARPIIDARNHVAEMITAAGDAENILSLAKALSIIEGARREIVQ